jgi:hypothetical protein
MAGRIVLVLLDSKPFRHIGETIKVANCGTSAEFKLDFEDPP